MLEKILDMLSVPLPRWFIPILYVTANDDTPLHKAIPFGPTLHLVRLHLPLYIILQYSVLFFFITSSSVPFFLPSHHLMGSSLSKRQRVASKKESSASLSSNGTTSTTTRKIIMNREYHNVEDSECKQSFRTFTQELGVLSLTWAVALDFLPRDDEELDRLHAVRFSYCLTNDLKWIHLLITFNIVHSNILRWKLYLKGKQVSTKLRRLLFCWSSCQHVKPQKNYSNLHPVLKDLPFNSQILEVGCGAGERLHHWKQSTIDLAHPCDFSASWMMVRKNKMVILHSSQSVALTTYIQNHSGRSNRKPQFPDSRSRHKWCSAWPQLLKYSDAVHFKTLIVLHVHLSIPFFISFQRTYALTMLASKLPT